VDDEMVLLVECDEEIFRAARYTPDDFPFNVLDALRDCLSQIAPADDQLTYGHVDQMRLDAAACGFDFG
jgi:hypothetical protein